MQVNDFFVTYNQSFMGVGGFKQENSVKQDKKKLSYSLLYQIVNMLKKEPNAIFMCLYVVAKSYQ